MNRIVVEKLSGLIEDKNWAKIRDSVADLHPADIAEVLQELSLDQQIFLIDHLDNEVSSMVLLELDEEDRKKILHSFSPKEIAEEMIQEMDSDDAADVIAELSDQKKGEVIAQIDDEEHAKSIVDLLKYNEDSAGGIMAKELIKVQDSWTVLTAVKEMRKQAESLELEEVYSIYVVDEKDKLLGLLNLKKLLTTTTSSLISQVYNPKVLKVAVADDAEDVASTMQKYDLFEIPVVDELNRLVGRITIDDVIDRIEERDTEDIHKFGGTEGLDLSYTKASLSELVKKRAGWLVLLFLGEMFTASAMGHYNDEISKAVVLTLFIPLIISSGGNSGSQAASLIIRAMALKELHLKDWWLVMRKEIFSGLILGSILAIIGFIRIFTWQKMGLYDYGEYWFWVSLSVSLSLIFVVLWGTLSGSLVPFLLKRIGLDPATASAPFVATLVDVTGLVIYFTLSSILLSGKLL